MDLFEIKAALDSGKNLCVVGGKVMLVSGVNLNRPKNAVELKNIDSGKGYVCAPGQVSAMIGSVDASALPFVKTGEDGEPQEPSIEDRFSPYPLTLANGDRVNAGEKVKIRSGEIVTYLGFRPKGQKYPYGYKASNGKVYKAMTESFLAKAS